MRDVASLRPEFPADLRKLYLSSRTVSRLTKMHAKNPDWFAIYHPRRINPPDMNGDFSKVTAADRQAP